MNQNDFVMLVKRMREAQKKYFITLSKFVLLESKELEWKVDKQIEILESKMNEVTEMSNEMCNDCWLSMQNCHDKSICCEMEGYDGDECDWFEPMHIVHGHWINRFTGRHFCSICQVNAPSFRDGKENLSSYCPTCGAKMS